MPWNRHYFLSKLLVLLTATILLASNASKSTKPSILRYRSGVLNKEATEEEGHQIHELVNTTVADAREHCRWLPDCISFSFYSPLTRFPGWNVTAIFIRVADWHLLKQSGESAFIQDPNWHSYTNTTRELEALPREIETLLKHFDKISSSNHLRGVVYSNSVERKRRLIESLFSIVSQKELRTVAAPLLVPVLIEISTDKESDEAIVVRQAALRILHVIADTPDTGQLLLDFRIFQTMKKLIHNDDASDISVGHAIIIWDETQKLALDILANVCFHRSVNAELKRQGALSFLRELLSEPGFPGLEAAMALAHISQDDIDLPKEKIKALMDLLRNAIDGDIAYGIRWDLIPGPLSAIQFLVKHHHHHHHNAVSNNDRMDECLLDAGLMEELLRILEVDCLVASDVEAALEIMQHLSQVSERARHMILLSEHTLHDTELRLRKYNPAVGLVSGVIETITKYDHDHFGRWVEEL